MPLPPGLSTVTVTGTYRHPDGTPMSGRVIFEPEPAILTSGQHGTFVLGDTVATLDSNGAFTATLLATDDPDVTPTGWTYRVGERWYDVPGRSYPLSLPAATPTVDLADVAPTAPAEGEYVVVTGPQGPVGPQGPAGPAGPKGDPGDPATNLVESVNGEQGAVVLDAADVSADPAGAASAAVTSHTAAADPHGDRAYTTGITGPLADRVTNVEIVTTTLNTYITDALNRIQSLEARMTSLEARVTALENP